MKNISTGFGLCVAAAAALAYPFVDNLAPSANASTAAAAVSDVTKSELGHTVICEWGEPLPLFGNVRVMPELPYLCSLGNYIEFRPDLDGNGAPENTQYEGILRMDGVLRTDPVVWHVALHLTDAPPRVTLHGLIDSNALWVFAVGAFPGIESFSWTTVENFQYFDFDSDGDLDLSFSIRGSNCDGCGGGPGGKLWVENQSPRRSSSADINRDGQVDGADLGDLLSAWGS
jgi:hypothetical protein